MTKLIYTLIYSNHIVMSSTHLKMIHETIKVNKYDKAKVKIFKQIDFKTYVRII